MVAEELIEESDRSIVMRALLLKHRHVNDHSHGGFMFGSRRKFSLYNSLQVRQIFIKIEICFLPMIESFYLVHDPKHK